MGLLTEEDVPEIPFSPHRTVGTETSVIGAYKALGVSTCSYQVSLKLCLELLGTRSKDVPVVMAITSPPATISAVLRSGAQPVLIDVDEGTLQVCPEVLAEVLEELKGHAVVLLHRPGGAFISEDMHHQLEKVPTIVSAGFLCGPQEVNDHLLGSFNIFDGRTEVGAGSLLFHDYPKQISELRVLRSGLLGYEGDLALPLHEDMRRYVTEQLTAVREVRQEVARGYEQAAKSLGREDLLGLPNSDLVAHYLLRVSDSQKTVAHLSSFGVQSKLGVFPLHYVDVLRKRWQEEPSYPVAEALSDSVIALPVHSGVLGSELTIIEKVLEVCDAP